MPPKSVIFPLIPVVMPPPGGGADDNDARTGDQRFCAVAKRPLPRTGFLLQSSIVISASHALRVQTRDRKGVFAKVMDSVACGGRPNSDDTATMLRTTARS